MGRSKKRPDLESVWPQERMDPAGSTCSPDRVPVHTNCTKCVCDHGFYPDHQYRHGSLSITNASLVGRSFPSQGTKQGKRVNQPDGWCRRIISLFWRGVSIQPVWKISSIRIGKHKDLCCDPGYYFLYKRTKADRF